MQTKEIISST